MNPFSTTSDPINSHQGLNLQSINSGDNLYSVTITWNGDITPVELTDNSSISPFTFTANGNSHIFNMAPGDFMDISIKAITDDSIYVDSIQIFTRPIYPVSNFEFEVESIPVGKDVYNSWETFYDKGDETYNEGEEFVDELNGKTTSDGPPGLEVPLKNIEFVPLLDNAFVTCTSSLAV